MVAFYNQNSGRDYPFISGRDHQMSLSGGGNAALPHNAIVDALFILSSDGTYEPNTEPLYLKSIARSGSQFLFTFASDAASITDEITFCADLNDEEYSVSYSVTGTNSSASAGICESPQIRGWVVFGSMESLAAVLPDGQSLSRSDSELEIETARIQDMSKTLLNSINLSNKDRTRYVPPDECRDGSSASPLSYIDYVTCLQGRIRFKEGYNCLISQNQYDNSVVIGALVGGGDGEPCEEVPLFPGESPPEGSKLLSGGPACDELIKSINGVPGPLIQFLSGTGVEINEHPTKPHTLQVKATLRGLAICPPEESSSSQSQSLPSEPSSSQPSLPPPGSSSITPPSFPSEGSEPSEGSQPSISSSAGSGFSLIHPSRSTSNPSQSLTSSSSSESPIAPSDSRSSKSGSDSSSSSSSSHCCDAAVCLKPIPDDFYVTNYYDAATDTYYTWRQPDHLTFCRECDDGKNGSFNFQNSASCEGDIREANYSYEIRWLPDACMYELRLYASGCIPTESGSLLPGEPTHIGYARPLRDLPPQENESSSHSSLETFDPGCDGCKPFFLDFHAESIYNEYTGPCTIGALPQTVHVIFENTCTEPCCGAPPSESSLSSSLSESSLSSTPSSPSSSISSCCNPSPKCVIATNVSPPTGDNCSATFPLQWSVSGDGFSGTVYVTDATGQLIETFQYELSWDPQRCEYRLRAACQSYVDQYGFQWTHEGFNEPTGYHPSSCTCDMQVSVKAERKIPPDIGCCGGSDVSGTLTMTFQLLCECSSSSSSQSRSLSSSFSSSPSSSLSSPRSSSKSSDTSDTPPSEPSGGGSEPSISPSGSSRPGIIDQSGSSDDVT